MSLRRFIVRGLGVIAAIGIIALGIALWVYRDIPAAELEARYASPASRFITIDGARIHYRDEGSGPPVVLIHANFSNLIDWDPWVDALRDRYRVIRFDMTSHGLTGPDPTGDYSQERTLALTERLIDALDLEQDHPGRNLHGRDGGHPLLRGTPGARRAPHPAEPRIARGPGTEAPGHRAEGGLRAQVHHAPGPARVHASRWLR